MRVLRGGWVVAVVLGACGGGGGDAPEGSGYRAVHDEYVAAFRTLCGAAVGCYGPSENALYDCQYYVSTVRVGISPVLSERDLEIGCTEAVYGEDAASVEAFLDCHAENERRAAECVDACPMVTDACHRARHDGTVACQGSVTAEALMRIGECID